MDVGWNHWTNKKNCIVLFSGGLDSTVALYLAVKQFGKENVMALNVYYRQKHQIEQNYAQQTALDLGIKYRTFDLSSVYTNSMCNLLEGREDVAHGDYAEQTEEARAKGEERLATTVPFRNGLMLALCTAIAEAEGYELIMYGAHQDDAGAMYADCSPEFIRTMHMAIKNGTRPEIMLHAPFMNMHKKDIVAMGAQLKVPFENTWSCYDPQHCVNGTVESEKACGKCGTCIDRLKAFEANGLEDPLTYI